MKSAWTVLPVPSLPALGAFNDPALQARVRRALPGTVEVALVLLLAVQAARLAWLALVPPGPIGPAASALPPARPVATMAAADVFHRQGNATALTGSDQALGFRLHGLRAAAPDGSMPASAILAGKDGVQRAWREGESPGDGVILAQVGGDHAVLRSGDGREHRIDLPSPSPASGAKSVRALPSALPASAAATSSVSATTTGKLAPDELLASTGLRANADGGYTLTPRGNGALFRQAGLEPGDVLTAVNGQPLDRERMRELESELKNRSEAVLTVKRDGQTRTITLQARQP